MPFKGLYKACKEPFQGFSRRALALGHGLEENKSIVFLQKRSVLKQNTKNKRLVENRQNKHVFPHTINNCKTKVRQQQTKNKRRAQTTKTEM